MHGQTSSHSRHPAEVTFDLSQMMGAETVCNHCGGKAISDGQCDSCGSNDTTHHRAKLNPVPWWMWAMCIFFPPLIIVPLLRLFRAS